MDTLAIVSDHLRPWVERAAIAAWGVDVEPAVVLGCTDCDATRMGGPVLAGVDVRDPAALVRAVAGLGDGVGLLSWDDGLIVPVARAAAALGVPHARVDGLERARNKASMRRRLHERGLPCPRFAVVAEPSDVAVVAASVGFPAIVKPVNGTGSALVRRVDDAAALAAAASELLALPEGALDGLLDREVPDPDGPPTTARGGLLVEECVAGPEVDVEVVVRAGRAVPCLTTEVGFDDGTFREAYFLHPPTHVDDATLTLVLQQVPVVLEALAVDDCVLNMTFIVDERRGPVVIEVNAGRPGGHLLAGMAWYVAGADIPAEAVALACGVPAPERVEPSGSTAAAVSFFSSTYGRLAGVRGLDDLRAHPNVVSAVELAEVGTELTPLQTAYPAAALLRDVPSREALDALRAELADLVTVDVRPVGGTDVTSPSASRSR